MGLKCKILGHKFKEKEIEKGNIYLYICERCGVNRDQIKKKRWFKNDG